MITLNFDLRSKNELDRKFKKLNKSFPEKTFSMVIKLLFDIKFLAQKKIKADKHILTSRLRNSIFVKTKKPIIRPDNKTTYSDNEGNSFASDLATVRVGGDEGAVGTNVVYAGKIERLDSFLYWAAKHADVDKRASELSKELLGDIR